MKPYAFGVDIGGTTIKLGLFETTGRLLEKWEIATDIGDCGKQILSDIAVGIAAKMAERKLSVADVSGVGLGVPGPVLEDGTVVKCVNLGWGVFNVEKELANMTGMPVRAGNDANVAALGEMWQGGGEGFSNVVMVTLGTGVGGGVIVDEKIVTGAFGAGGEIGHIQMRTDETECCGCGKRGCLEQYASANGIVKEAGKLLNSSPHSSILRENQTLTAKYIFAAAGNGDELATEVIEGMGKDLGRALSYISCVCDPQVFVIGGGVANAGAIVTDTIQKHYRRFAFHASRNAAFKLATLGNDAGMYGSVKLLLSGHR